MVQSDPLDRALADLEAVVLKQLHPRQSERLIGGKVDDGALQRLACGLHSGHWERRDWMGAGHVRIGGRSPHFRSQRKNRSALRSYR
jgi:hypothetical protein